MRKYIVFLILLLVAFVSVGCKDNQNSFYKDGKIFECESYYKTINTSRFNILEKTLDEFGEPNTGFQYYRLVFFADRTFAFVSFPYSTNVEEIYYGTWAQKDETFEVLRVDANGKVIRDAEGKLIYDEVVKSVITLDYENPIISGENIFGYEKYVISLDQLTLTRNQPQITSEYQATVEQVWKRIDIKDVK